MSTAPVDEPIPEGAIDITGLDKAEVLAALFNAAQPQGMGFAQNYAPAMTVTEARERLAGTRADFGDRRAPSFDYVRGRVLKVNIGRDYFMPGAYDRDNGQGTAARVVAELHRLKREVK